MAMTIPGTARTLDLTARSTSGIVAGLYPRAVGVCTTGDAAPMLPSEFAKQHGTAGVDSVKLIAGVGMEGDRYAKGISAFSGAKRSSHLTLIAQEDLEAVADEYGVRLQPSDALRNIVTSGI